MKIQDRIKSLALAYLSGHLAGVSGEDRSGFEANSRFTELNQHFTSAVAAVRHSTQ